MLQTHISNWLIAGNHSYMFHQKLGVISVAKYCLKLSQYIKLWKGDSYWQITVDSVLPFLPVLLLMLRPLLDYQNHEK